MLLCHEVSKVCLFVKKYTRLPDHDILRFSKDIGINVVDSVDSVDDETIHTDYSDPVDSGRPFLIKVFSIEPDSV